MSAGCFSCCCLPKPWGSRKRNMDTKFEEQLPEKRLAIVPKTQEYTSVQNRVVGTKPDEKLPENTRTAAPTTTRYIAASGKQVLIVLQSAAGVIPVPLLQEAIGVALKIIDVIEGASAVEGKVKELQERVGNLMMIIVAHVTPEGDGGSDEAVMKAAEGIKEDIKGLLGTLKTINKGLTEINEQDRWLTALYQQTNMSALEDCMNRLSTALEKFKLASDLRGHDLLQELVSRLGKMTNKIDDISRDVRHVAVGIDNLGGKLEGFDKVMARLEQSTMPLPSETVVREEIPLKPWIFYGRDGLVEDIVQWIMKEESSRVCILGPGGMGKTSVSLAVAESPRVRERFQHGNIIWVPCIVATSAALLREILYVQLGIPGDKQITLEKIISELSASKDPRLILLDNFETPWNAPGGQKEVEDILHRLAQLNHVAIFVTMRGNYPPSNIKWQSKNIQPTDEEACLRIFHEINPSSKADPDVSRLLSTLGHMPFAVTLMANLGKEGQSTARELLDAWSKSGPDIISDNLEQGMNRSIGLSVDSDLVKLNPNAVLLLDILSLLPAGTTKENICWWAPELETSMIPSAIAALSKVALLVENKRQDSDIPVLFVVPVVQSFMQQHDRIPDEVRKQIHSSCCQYVLNHACRHYDSTFPVKSKMLADEDTNIQSILFCSFTTQHADLSDVTMEALIAFNWHRCDTKPSLEIANHIVTVAKASHTKRHIASALWCLGRTYFQLCDFYSAYDHLQEAYQLFDTLPSTSNDLKLPQLSGQCGIDFAEAAQLTLHDVTKILSFARDVERKCATLLDAPLHGRSLLCVASALHDAKQWQEALCYVNRALTILEAVKNAYNLADAYQMLARVHYYELRLPEALDALKEAWKQAEMSHSLNVQGYISQCLGMALFNANNDMEAWKYIEISLTKASQIGSQLAAARALQYMGYGYLRQGEYQNAYQAYEAAAEKYCGTCDAWVETKCKDNMARIQQKQRNPDAVIGFCRPNLDVDKSLLFPPVQLQMSESKMPIPNS